MTKPKTPRLAGARWRILVHEWLGRGHPTEYGVAHHVTSDPEFGRLPRNRMSAGLRKRMEELDRETAHMRTETVLAGTEFDELVLGKFLHLEQMDTGTWWMAVGGVVLWIRADRDGRPKSVHVYGPGRYDEPVPGVEYELDWAEPSEEAKESND